MAGQDTAIAATLCPICQSPLAAGEAATACPACATVHHQDCWQEVGGCGIYGCSRVPAVDKRSDLELPPAFWGKETKPCPNCGKEIQAMAVRCRHCRAEMSVGTGGDRQDWKDERAELAGRAGLRRRCLQVFFACVIPPLAPIAAVPALVWLLLRWRSLRTVGSLHRALAVVGVCLAWLLVLGLVLALVIARFTSHQGS